MIDKYINKIINADCMDILKELPDKCVDLVLTDPPYKKVQGGCTNYAVRLRGATKNNLSQGKYFNENTIKFEEWMPEIYRVLKDNTHCYIFSDDRNLNEVLTIGKKNGFKLLNILTWKKSKHSPNRYYLKNAEFIVMFRKGKAKNINNMGTYQVLEFDNAQSKIHPSQKPYDLIKCLLLNSSNENDIVLDPFSGSCPVAIASKNLKRKFICCEIDKNIYENACERMDILESQKRLF